MQCFSRMGALGGSTCYASRTSRAWRCLTVPKPSPKMSSGTLSVQHDRDAQAQDGLRIIFHFCKAPKAGSCCPPPPSSPSLGWILPIPAASPPGDGGRSQSGTSPARRSSRCTRGCLGWGKEMVFLQMWFQLFFLQPSLCSRPRSGPTSPSRLKMRSPKASTMSLRAASSVTLKKYFSSGSLAMYLISRMKSSGSCCRRR